MHPRLPIGGSVDVTVPAAWLEQGALPPVCARHGVPSTHLNKRTFTSKTPSWTFILILVSLLLFAIVAYAIQKRVQGQLPACRECTKSRRSFLGAVWAGWVTCAVLFFVAVPIESSALWAFWGLCVLAALVGMLVGDHLRVRGRVNEDTRWVTLSGTHLAFAMPVRDAVQGRPAAPMSATDPLRAAVSGATILPGR